VQIPKAQKESHQCLFALLGSSSAKAAHKMFVTLIPDKCKLLDLKK